MDYSEQVGIDLHIHTTASDGTLTPSEVISQALKLKLKAIAITDHDTLAGSKEALQAGIPSPLNFLTGVEISAAPPRFYAGSGSFHLLGYSIRLDNPALNHALEKLQQARKNRNPTIVSRLNDIGIMITLDEVRQEAGEGQLGRPHIATVLVKRGIVGSIDQAFDRYLGTDGPAYVDKFRIECHKAIELILAAGGIPVLAHPGLLKCKTSDQYVELIAGLKELGIQGVEVFYPEHTPEQTRLFAELAQRHNLLLTGGTDFHGSIHPEITIGSGKGDLFVPYELYEKLINPP
ncbi:FIG00031715: Predicted metal-dependent phosphoesterases (PHP family) [Olavius sp. associated proteobacterium Delta 1]|nr:FIG00031715: Predicted metal-dependent phosphoesterases (PHP family) [Olavius sp. associated proteobacterium Delta 1]